MLLRHLAGTQSPQAAFEQFAALQQQRIRIGSQDHRVAAIALANAAIL